MSRIEVKFDHNLTLSDIIIPLTNSSPDESGEYYTDNQQEVQQTSVYGIQAPLIMVNNIVIDFTDIVSFELQCDSVVPQVDMVVRDRKNLIQSIDTPGVDNELRVQILPKFEDRYKKINLAFFITNFEAQNDNIRIFGEYKSPKLCSSVIKCYGKINTYNLFSTIAKETDMGFSSNIVENNADLRYVYCQNTTRLKTLKDEIKKSGSDLQILDYWIDWWNNIVLVDVYERYNAIDPDEDLRIWIASQNNEVDEGKTADAELAPALLNNHPANKRTELFVESYELISNAGVAVTEGADNVCSVYQMGKKEYMDHLISDGDKQKDVVTKLEYNGEVYGEFNYLLQGKKRKTFLAKMESNDMIKVKLNSPLLGLMRGNRVNFNWYVNDARFQTLKENMVEGEVANTTNHTNVSLDEGDVESTNTSGEFIIDESISGQYLIKECVITWKDSKWGYTLVLARPSKDKPKLINDIQNE
jgi:hypothetical protein